MVGMPQIPCSAGVSTLPQSGAVKPGRTWDSWWHLDAKGPEMAALPPSLSDSAPKWWERRGSTEGAHSPVSGRNRNISQLSAGPAGADGCGDIILLDKCHDPGASRSLLPFLKCLGRESCATWASPGSVPGFSQCLCWAFPGAQRRGCTLGMLGMSGGFSRGAGKEFGRRTAGSSAGKCFFPPFSDA